MAEKNDAVLGAAGAPQNAPNSPKGGSARSVDSVPSSSVPQNKSELYKTGSPEPEGTQAGEERRDQSGRDTDPTAGIGTDGEDLVWEARYSMLNFLGRGILLVFLTIGWCVLANKVWGPGGHPNWAIMAWICGGFVAICWLYLVYHMLLARFSHYYRLTTRRLFVSVGVFRRKRYMMELLKLKDVSTRQANLFDRMVGLGMVVAESSEHGSPMFYMPGVYEPKRVMDLVWHHARSERDQRSMKVESI